MALMSLPAKADQGKTYETAASAMLAYHLASWLPSAAASCSADSNGTMSCKGIFTGISVLILQQGKLCCTSSTVVNRRYLVKYYAEAWSPGCNSAAISA